MSDSPPDAATRTAGDLISALWRTTPPELRSDAASAHEVVAALAATLLRIASEADALGRAPDEEDGDTHRAAAHCLAETAAAIGNVLDSQPAAAVGMMGIGGTLPSSVRLRLARMERWLAERAAVDATAEPSANLCLWVLECLEERGG